MAHRQGVAAVATRSSGVAKNEAQGVARSTPFRGGATCYGPSHSLEQLADQVRSLRPDRHDPERFHVEKDAIERQLRRLARGQA